MAVLKKIVLGLVVVAALLVAVAYVLPRRVHFERSVTINAPRSTVFALVQGFRSFNKWSPWYELDPKAAYTFEGQDFGVGARLSWVGDPKTVDSGSQEIVEVRRLEAVRTKLQFGKETAESLFTLTPDGSGTRVTWSFECDTGMNPIRRYFGLTMEKMIAPDYEKGLANLKKLAESLPKTDFADLRVEKVEVPAVTLAYVSATSSKDEKAIGEAIGGAYQLVANFLTANGLKPAGSPITINTKWDDAGYQFDAGIPIDREPTAVADSSPVKVKQTYSGPALKVVHKGAYSGMPATYEKLFAFAAVTAYEQAAPPFDEYVTDPSTTAEADLITNVYLPVK